ncbi:hypothetical protein ACLBXM_21365 [Xanthobacteraceae bacterium A53D]
MGEIKPALIAVFCAEGGGEGQALAWPWRPMGFTPVTHEWIAWA